MIVERDLLILVGLTGVGKTTTVRALRECVLAFDLLPNRRALTDEHMIGWLQDRDGQPRTPVVDRAERFALTRRYREIHPGGMAHVLAGLCDGEWSSPLLVFDGLRGVSEVLAAARELPRSRFLVLTAPHGVRLLRLLGRDDDFDTIGRASSARVDADFGLVESQVREQVRQLVESGDLDPAEVSAKLSILEREHENYSQDVVLAGLRQIAPERIIEARTECESPLRIASRVRATLLPGATP